MSEAVAAPARTGTNLTRAWAAVAALTLVGVLNFVDRFLPAVLAEPIKQDLALSDTAIGLINGFGFLVIYAVLGIPIARLADRGAYGLVISGCLGLWSVMTMLGGLAQSGWQLALTRMGVAVGEAGSSPAAHAFISRNFPPDRRAAPLAVLAMAVPLSATAGLIGGGLLGEALGWRKAFLVMGGISLLLVPLVLLLLGTKRHGAAVAADHAQPAKHGALSLLKKRSYVLILAASACVAVGGYSVTTFAPAFLMRVHGLSVGEVGVQYGIASGVVGVVGLVIAGWLADRLSTRDPRWLVWLVAAMMLLLLPLSISAFVTPDQRLAVIFVAFAYFAGTAYMGPVISAIQRLAHVDQRATASAILLFSQAMLGGIGPYVTGAISDHLQPELGAHSLARALLIAPAMHLVAALLYLAASTSFRRDLAD